MWGRTNSLSILDGTAGELLEERAVLPRLTRIQGAPGVLTAIVGKDSNRTGLISAHLPPKATLDETEDMLSRIGDMPAMQQPRLVLGFDCNETFDF